MERQFTITIIGGGFSGTILATQFLLKNKDLPLKIRIIEKSLQVGRGVAFSTSKDYHLLNVRADNMSALADKPQHFVEWLKEKKIPLSASTHMPRKIYGDYLSEVLKTAQASASSTIELELLWGEASDIEFTNGKARVYMNNGSYLESDKVVLALGNFPPGSFSSINSKLSTDKRYCGDPWSCDYSQKINENDTVLIIGTGLTMIDTCMTLAENNHKGKIISISHHGYLPVVHHDSAPYPAFYDEIKHHTSILEIFKTVRKHFAIALDKGIDWRSVIDSLRPYTQQLWLQLPKKEKEIFLTNLNRIWSVVRHRIPPEYYKAISNLRLSNQLEIIAGKLLSLEALEEKIAIEFIKKKSNSLEKVKVDFVINCTGPQLNYTKLNYPLVKNLLAKKMIKPGPFNLGIEALPDGKIVSDLNTDILYTLGPPLTGVLFESTAVPEIRHQAKNLALKLIHDLRNIPKKVRG